MRIQVPYYRPRLAYFAAAICFLCGFYFVKDVLQQSFRRDPMTHDDTEEPGQQILNAEVTRSTRHLLSSENKKETCTPPAILEFPRYFMNNDQRVRGGFLICLIIALYMFWAIAIVCDDYFVPALDVICEKMNLQTDVAGATFMAFGSSAPELFASMIGVLITKGDIGTGTILGSAVFNVLFVIGVCGLFSGQVLELSWWPMVRDLMSYLLALLVLVLVIMDGIIMWYEAVLMMCSYSLYLVLMFFNERLERFAYRITNTTKHVHTPEHHLGYTGLAPARDVGDDDMCAKHHHQHHREERMHLIEGTEVCPETTKTGDTGTLNKGDSKSVGELNSSQVKENGLGDETTMDVEKADIETTNQKHATYLKKETTEEIEKEGTMESSTLLNKIEGDEYSNDSGSEFDLALGSRLQPPTGHWQRLGWGLSLPINLCFYLTIPDVRKTSCHKWCPVTFIVCIAWIAITSYVLVWMVTLVGFTFGVPDTVMGLTLVAFGSSVPDCMSSLVVAKKGDGDMACSHTVGSNVFDIFLCLGIPWTIKTTVLSTKSSFPMRSHGLFISSFFIMASIILTFLMMHFHDWKLTKRVGLVYLVVYFIFITMACVVELNVFGYFNPPMCKISSSV